METQHLDSGDEGIAAAAALLRRGRLVAFPTETVYGLGASARDEDAVRAIYEAKGRPATNPLIVHIADEAMARACAADWPDEAALLARAFWPGPLTIIVLAAEGLSATALAGGSTVGLRVPDHSTALALIREAGVPVAAPSANRSGRLSPVRAEHVLEDLGGRIDAVVDGGACRVGIESTVLDLTAETPRILRPGDITADQIARVIGRDVRMKEENAAADETLKSPGLFSRHYAPRVPLRIVSEEELAAAPEGVYTVILPADPREAARELYARLWEIQKHHAREIWIAEPPAEPGWEALRDRLRRAAAES